MNNLNLKIEKNFAIIEFDQQDSKVNVLNTQLMNEFSDVLIQLRDKTDLKGVFLVSKKPGIFIAGADVKEIENINTPAEAEEKSKSGQEILNILEELSIPSYALINGVCLGGGLELALACDYRIATFSEKVKLGLPEVKLGIIPGFGGTKRLPDLIGFQKGLELILSGKILGAKESLKIGLVDLLCSENRLLESAYEFSEKNNKKRIKKKKIKGLLNILLNKTPLGRKIVLYKAKKSVLKTTKGHYPAPILAIDVINKNYTSTVSESLERERKIVAYLITTDISKNLIKVFYLTEKYKKQVWASSTPKEIHKCGLLGAGVMGGGIAQLISSCNIPVRMKDVNYSALASGLNSAKKVYDYGVSKRKITKSEAIFKIGLISATTEYSGFKNVDLVIEAIIEDINIKKKVFSELSKISKNAILATNTSALSIDEIASDCLEPERVVGMHFFNPVYMMPLIEVIRGKRTSEVALSTIVEFSRKLGKFPIVVKDSCGFLINRILIPYINEAGFILESGIPYEIIDSIATKFGLPMGPFALIDEIGLDVGYKVAKILENYFGDRMKVASVLAKVYENKLLGKKTGKGFYIHKGKEKIPNKDIYDIFSISKKEAESKAESLAEGLVEAEKEILNRMIYLMINEASRCLEEGICNEPSDVDIGMIMGIGFPPFRAGLLRYADSVGLSNIMNELEKFYKLYGEKFKPSNYLLKLVKENKKFY